MRERLSFKKQFMDSTPMTRDDKTMKKHSDTAISMTWYANNPKMLVRYLVTKIDNQIHHVPYIITT